MRYQYKDYHEYMWAQLEAAQQKSRYIWAKQEYINIISDYIRKIIKPENAICHGSRRGKEVAWFMKQFPKCHVMGTDIFVTSKSKRFVIQWDMHNIKYEWLNLFDFIYSNSWDHFYDPEYGFDQWGRTVKSGGLIILEWSDCHGDEGVSRCDPLGGSLDEIIEFVSSCLSGFDFLEALDLNIGTNLHHKKALIWMKQ